MDVEWMYYGKRSFFEMGFVSEMEGIERDGCWEVVQRRDMIGPLQRSYSLRMGREIWVTFRRRYVGKTEDG